MTNPNPESLALRFRDSTGDHQHPLSSEEITLGRSPDCNLCIQHDTISRKHARIRSVDGKYLLEDLGSHNGIVVGSKKVDSVQLQAGMMVKLGEVTLVVDAPMPKSPGLELGNELPEQGILDSISITDIEQNLQQGAAYQESSSKDLGMALELFKDAADTLLTGSHLDQVTQGAISLSLKALPIDRCFLCLLEDGELSLSASGSQDHQQNIGQMELSTTIANQVIENKCAVIIRDTANQEDLAAAMSIQQMNIVSAMCAPLITEGVVFGILYVDCIKTHRVLNSDHLSTISVLALMVASAIQQFRFRQNAEEEKRRRVDLSCRLSPNVVDKVLSGQAELGSKEAEISVLFADLVGFTTMSEALAPREVVELLNQLFEDLTAEVFRQEGTLDKYIGDALVAFFGAPEAQSDHAARAVRTAIAMQHRIREIASAHPEWPPLSMRIGINSGPAVVGDIGSKLRSDYTVIGDTVNTASRFESQVAKSGEIAIGPYTAELCGDLFQMEQLEETPLKGKKQIIRPWKVLGHR